MPIEIARDALSRIRKNPQDIVIHVRKASDPDAAITALKAASEDIYRLGRPSIDNPEATEQGWNSIEFMTGILPTPDGPFLLVEAGETPFSVLKRIPELVANRLAEHGVKDAVIAFPGSSAIWGGALRTLPRCVTMLALPPPPLARGTRSKLPDGWLDIAAQWLTGTGGEGLWADVETLQFPIGRADVHPLLVRCRQRGARVVMLAGDLDSRVRGVSARWMFTPDIELAFGGPQATDDELVEAFESLVDVARGLASDAVSVFVTIEPTFGSFGGTPHGSEWKGPDWTGGIRLLCDEIVLDAFPYQILGPRHLGRLGGVPPGATDIGSGRVELRIGDPAQWLLTPDAHDSLSPWTGLSAKRRDKSIQARARELLAPCLVTSREGWQRLKVRHIENEARLQQDSTRRADLGGEDT